MAPNVNRQALMTSPACAPSAPSATVVKLVSNTYSFMRRNWLGACSSSVRGTLVKPASSCERGLTVSF